MQSKSWRQRIRGLGVLAAFLSVALVVTGGPGHRFGVIPDVGIALRIFAAGAIVAALAVVLLLVAAFLKRRNGEAGWGMHLFALLLATAIVVQFGMAVKTARSVPPIHDITTDTTNPPQFKALAAARADAPNPIEYAGDEVAAAQREAYPDIQTLQVAAAPAVALDAAEVAAAAQGWTVVRLDGENQLEATDVTFWFGFKDDVIVRVTPTGDGSAIDIRSKSRVGISDVGANAARIRTLAAAIKAQLSAQ
ncbi:MAG: DUF1499 domain-containing protein [Pseudomonadota bacterium]